MLIVIWAVAIIASLMWVARDARKRKQGFAIVVLCFFTWPFGILAWPFGILAWLLLRPSLKSLNQLS